MKCATFMVIFVMLYETLESRNHNSINNIILIFHLLCFFNSCSSEKPCSLNCGDCGVCLWNNNTKKEFCETSYLKQLFNQNPPTCSLTNACIPTNPCLNGGTCESKFGSYSCLCTNQYHGQECQVRHEVTGNYPSGLFVAYSPSVKLLENTKILISIDNIGHKSFQLIFANGEGDAFSFDKSVLQKGFTRKICEDEIGYAKACNTISISKQSQYMIIKTVYAYLTESENFIVQSDGPTVIGRHIQFEIQVYNYNSNSPSLDYKFPCVLDYRLQKSVDCIPTVQLKNCGEFKRKTTISLRSIVKPNKNCKEEGNLLLEWNVFTFSGNFDENRSLFESRSKVTEYVIPQFSMPVGVYRVKLSGTAKIIRDKISETHSNFAYCHLDVVEDPLSAMIKGGNRRNVYSEDVVILDGSRSSDPNEPPNKQNHLTYIWECDLLETICNTVVSKESRYTVGHLRKGKVYTFSLTVRDTVKNRKSVSAIQVINVIGSKIVDIEIVCLQNCGENFKSNTHEIIYFKIEVVGNSARSMDMNFSWMYSEKSGPLQSVDGIREMDTPNDVLIIKANMLQEGSRFDFRLQVVDSEAQSTITVITDQSPEGGNCSISPESGVAATSFFDIVCQNFTAKLEDVTGLNYEFYAGEPSTGILLGFNKGFNKGINKGFNNLGKLIKVVLSQNNITVRVSNSFGMYVDKHIFVQIDPLNATSKDIDTLMFDACELQKYGDSAGSIRLISAISDIIAELDDKLQITERLLNIMEKVRVTDFDDVKLYSLVLKKLVTQGVQGNINGLDTNCCKITSALMRKLSSKVLKIIVNSYNVSTDITTDELQTVVRVLLEIGDVVVSSRDSMIYNESAGALQVLRVYNVYKNAASDVVSSIEMLGRSIGHRLLPSQPEVVIKTTNSTLWVKFDTPKRLSNKTQTFSFGNNSVKISEKLIEVLKTKSDLIRLEVAVLYGNPYWWDQNEKNIVSDIILLRLFLQVSKHIIQIRNLQEPIDIFLKLKLFKTQVINGTVTMPSLNATEDEKDSAVSVHRIDSPPRGGNGKVVFHFKNIKPNDTLKVLVMKNMWPDYDFVTKEGQTITNTSYIYDVFLIDESPDMFLYIGLLPGSEVLPGGTISYTFEISTVQCQIRSGGEWNSKICKIGSLTRDDLIHCECAHLSIFGSSFLIAPNKLDLIKDISLFLTFPDNPGVVILVITLLILYLSTLVWAFLKDRRDKLQKMLIVLEDNYPGEKWGYLLTVFTGARMFAGTTANVGFEIIGKLSRSRAHVFRSRNRKVLQKGSDDWFLIFTSKHLGELERLHIWHDNSGSSPDWYCVKIVVHDLVFKKEYSFLVESWFCIGTYGKFVEAMLKPSSLKDITHWNRLVMSNAFYYFREAHLWMSIFFCHPRTCLTRTHRVSIATSLIMSTLLTSIMFYGIAAVEGVDEGSYSIKTREIIIAIESALITTPITFLIVFFFRKSRIVREVQNEPVEEESFKKDTEIKESDINEHNDNKYVSNVEESYQNKSDVVTSEEKSTETRIKRIFLYLSSIVHVIIKPKPLTPIQISNIPTTTVVERPKFAIIGWILCQTCIWASAFFIMLYGLKLGKITSELWMTATLFGIAQGIFISSPIKLFIYSIILALAFQKMYDVITFEVNLIDAIHLDKVGNEEFLTNLIQLRSQPEYHPLPRLTLLDMHKRKMPTKSWAPVLKFGMVTIFTIILLIAVGDLWSAKFYTTNAHIKTMLTTRGPHSVSFKDVSNIKRFGDYLLDTLIPALYTSKWYNKSPLSSKDEIYSSNEWANDASTRLLSVPRLRQIRVKPDVCVIPDLLKNITITCSSPLSDSTEDTGDYDTKWRQRFNISKTSSWVYNPRSDHLYLYGATGQAYHDGGYICDLGLTHKESNVIMIQLIDNRWIDRLTRVIFIELVLYNINTDVTSLVYLICELMPSEAFFSRIQVVSFSASMTFRAMIWILILMSFIILFVLQTVFKITGLGLRQFILSFWNMLELCVCVLCIICLIVHIVQIVTTSLLIEKFLNSGKETHLSMSLLMVFNHRMLFFLIFLTMLWFLKCFQLGYKIQTFYYTLKLCYHNIIWCVLVLVLFLFYIGWILSYIFNSPILSNFTLVVLYRMSYSNIISERISSSQKFRKVWYSYTCALGSVFCMIIIIYYRRLGKHYRYNPSTVNICNIILNKLKSFRAKNMKHGKLRLRGGTDIVDNTKKLFICNHLKISIPKVLHQTKLGLLNKNKICNFIENQNKISLTNSNSKYKTNGNMLLKNEDTCLEVTPSHNYIPADLINKHKFRAGISYDNCYSLDNSYYFERMLFNLDYIIEKLNDIDNICDKFI